MSRQRAIPVVTMRYALRWCSSSATRHRPLTTSVSVQGEHSATAQTYTRGASMARAKPTAKVQNAISQRIS